MTVLAIGFSNEEYHRIVRDAGAYAASTDRRLVVAHIVTESSFTRRQRAYAALDQWHGEYSIRQAEDRAESIARTVATDVLRDVSVEYLCVGRIGTPSCEIPHLAREYECEHLFMTRSRRPWYRLLSSDLLKDVSRSFSGPITTHPV